MVIAHGVFQCTTFINQNYWLEKACSLQIAFQPLPIPKSGEELWTCTKRRLIYFALVASLPFYKKENQYKYFASQATKFSHRCCLYIFICKDATICLYINSVENTFVRWVGMFCIKWPGFILKHRLYLSKYSTCKEVFQ